MKKSIIMDIFRGLRGSLESMEMPDGVDVNQAIVCKMCEELQQKLSPELYNLHERFVDALEEDWHNEVDFYFTQGFKVGVLIGIECMEE